MKHLRLFGISASGSLSVFFIAFLFSCGEAGNEEWKAPAHVHQLKSPLANDHISIDKGKALYDLYCRSCHGRTGFGDGPARGPLGIRPANFHRDRVRNQTNGDLFWKISTGRKDMPSFEKQLSEEQRWQVVTYIRNLPENLELIAPVALRPDIKVQHVMKVSSQAVRILQHPETGDIWYTTFDGNVFRVHTDGNKPPESEKVFSAADHGIATLQGAVFLHNTLFLCGNVYTDEKKSTGGRMVRFNLDSSKPHQLTVVFNTVKYAANKTIYDHGWNALVISPDEKFIYVNSGARTDHGEVQDNGGAYPGARDNALTSKIFRFPVDAKDLFLADDEEKMVADGYLYASGIRNAYDMNFDKEGNLFAVSNSADYDYPEDMFWIREHHHYGFPWVMGGLENPQQYDDWHPDPDNDAFINKRSHSWETKYYYNDREFPKPPQGIQFSPGVQNLGPDANEYRGHTGKIVDGDLTGVPVSTFTAHSCPLGLIFDTKQVLSPDFKGDGFVIRYSSGGKSGLMSPFTNQGSDLLHLRMEYIKATDNYVVHPTRIVEGFNDPVDAILVGNDIYVIEYGGKDGNIWKITLPSSTQQVEKTKATNKTHHLKS